MLNPKFLIFGVLATFVPGFIVAAVMTAPRQRAALVASPKLPTRIEIVPLPVADMVQEPAVEEPAVQEPVVAKPAVYKPLVIKAPKKTSAPPRRAAKILVDMNRRLHAMENDGGVQ